MRFLAILIPILAVFGADLPVEQWPLPDGALQPRVAVDGQGVVHAVWLRGDPQSSEVWYAQRSADAGSWMPAVRVDRGAGSAVAMGTVRGVHIALDGKDRAHLLWLGSAKAEPKSEDGSAPMLYSRAGESGFSVPINIIERGVGVDGGGAIAADDEGRVWVFWHASAGATEDAKRVVIFRRSTDAGATFGREQSAANRPTGACACCGMAAMADGSGGALAIFRQAAGNEDRSVILAQVNAAGKAEPGIALSPWPTISCPMSTATAVRSGKRMLVAWETDGQVSWTDITAGRPGTCTDAPGAGRGRKHPSVAVDASGRLCLAWVEGSGWNKAGRLRWQIWSADGKPEGDIGNGGELPVWGTAAVAPRPGSGFAIIR